MARNKLTRSKPRGDDQFELFVPDVGDLPIKDKQSIMALPLLHVGDYRGNAKLVDNVSMFAAGARIDIKAPADVGIATIRDYDVILFFISVLVDWLNKGMDASRHVELHAHSLLKFTRRGDGRKQYEMLEKTLERLKSTTITIKYSDGDKESVKSVGWLDEYKFERDELTGKFKTLHLSLPKWIYDATLNHKSVLKLHRDYFLLSSPQARWLYRLMRKSAGNNAEGWRFSLRELYERSGSPIAFPQWKYFLKKLLKTGPLLDYHTALDTDDSGSENLYFIKDEQLLNLLEQPPRSLHEFQKTWLSDDVVKLIESGVIYEPE